MKINILVLLVFIVLCFMAWSYSFKEESPDYSHDEYVLYIEEANRQFDLGVYVRAEQYYGKALSLNDSDIKVHYIYAKTLQAQNHMYDYWKKLDSIMRMFPDDVQAYDLLAKIYFETNNYNAVIDVIRFAQENSMTTQISQETKDIYYKSIYQYAEKGLYDDVVSFWENVAMVKSDGKWGYMLEGGVLIAPCYDDARPFAAMNLTSGQVRVAAVYEDGEHYFINVKGEKFIATNEDYDELIMCGENKMTVVKNGKYGYADVNLNPVKIEWDYAGIFKNSVAAVRTGYKWGLINSAFEYIVEPVYDDIKLNEVGSCIAQDIIIVKQNGKYFMVDRNGEELNDKKFDDIKQFAYGANKTYAAVCVDGKWGFADSDGEIKIEPKYDNADSFCAGIAPVCKDGKWGYIDVNEKYAIEPIFDEARCFNTRGIAAVKTDEKWKFIQLRTYIQ